MSCNLFQKIFLISNSIINGVNNVFSLAVLCVVQLRNKLISRFVVNLASTEQENSVLFKRLENKEREEKKWLMKACIDGKSPYLPHSWLLLSSHVFFLQIMFLLHSAEWNMNPRLSAVYLRHLFFDQIISGLSPVSYSSQSICYLFQYS